jgi:RNA polymerase sigma-70 factor (ECF subfamily)
MDSASDFAALYARHAPEVHRVANAVLRDHAHADEVVQDVFLSFWRDGGFDADRGTVGAYVRMLAHSRALDAVRRRGARDRMTARLHTQTDVASTAAADEPVLSAAEREVAREAVRKLPHDQRKAIVLTFWADMTAQETAVAEDIPLGTAKSRVRLGLRRLAADPALAA